MALRAAICFAALTVVDETPTLSEQMALREPARLLYKADEALAISLH